MLILFFDILTRVSVLRGCQVEVGNVEDDRDDQDDDLHQHGPHYPGGQIIAVNCDEEEDF